MPSLVEERRGNVCFHATCGTVLFVVASVLVTFSIFVIIAPGNIGHHAGIPVGNGTCDESTIGAISRLRDESVGSGFAKAWSTLTKERRIPSSDRKTCSRDCVCSRSGFSPYGRWCGYGYSGCEGVEPCDPLDACCMAHDRCVGTHGLMTCECHAALAACSACVWSQGKMDETQGWCEMTDEAAKNIVSTMEFLFGSCISESSKR